jgi:hypothetical protein
MSLWNTDVQPRAGAGFVEGEGPILTKCHFFIAKICSPYI